MTEIINNTYFIAHDITKAYGKIDENNVILCFFDVWSVQTNATVDVMCEAVEVLYVLFNQEELRELAYRLGIKIHQRKKFVVAMYIVGLIWKLWIWKQNSKVTCALEVLQNRWRIRRREALGPWPRIVTINTRDPYTYEYLHVHGVGNVVSYQDAPGKAYGFHAASLYKSMRIHNNMINPYTRKRFPKELYDRLIVWIKRQNIETLSCIVENDSWMNPLMAYTELAAALEARMGLFVQPLWFMSLDAEAIKWIFECFHKQISDDTYMSRLVETEAYMCLNINESHYAFVKEALRLVNDNHIVQHSHKVCCLMVAIADVCPQVAETLPDWVHDVVGIM